MKPNAPRHLSRPITLSSRVAEKPPRTRLETVTTLVQAVAAGLQALAAIVAIVAALFAANAVIKSASGAAAERSKTDAHPTTTQGKASQKRQ
jgi:hypothetical protein